MKAKEPHFGQVPFDARADMFKNVTDYLQHETNEAWHDMKSIELI